MSIEFVAADGRRATQTLFKESEIKAIKLVLGTTTILMTPEHEEGSKALNVCIRTSLEQQGSAIAPPLEPVSIAVADSLPSGVSQEDLVVMEEMTKEEFMDKLRGWIMVLASLFASMTFQAGINPPRQFHPDVNTPRQFQPDVVMGLGAQNRLQLFYQGRLFFLLNSIVFTYSLVLVMLMLFRSSHSVEKLVGGRRGFLQRSKRGLLCGNILLLLVAFGLGSAVQIYDMIIPLFGCSVLVCMMYYEKIQHKCKDWWKRLTVVF